MKAIRTALVILGAALIGGAPLNAAEVQLSWTGTLQGIFLDNGGVYTGATVGVTQFSGTFTYDVANVFANETSDGDNAVEPTDVWVDYFLHSASFSITNGTTEVSENQPTWFTLTIENDSPCSGSPDTPAECSDLTEIYGEPIDNPTNFDTWSVDASIGFPGSSLEIGIGFLSRDTSLFPAGDLALRDQPPWVVPSADNDHRAIFYIFEFDTVGGDEADIFSAWGTLDSVQVVEADADSDSVPDSNDNCTHVANPAQIDTNGDNIGNACDADIAGPGGAGDDDCMINFLDLTAMADAFFSTPLAPNWNPHADLAGAAGTPDNAVNFLDLDVMRRVFFGAPGPSGLPNMCDVVRYGVGPRKTHID